MTIMNNLFHDMDFFEFKARSDIYSAKTKDDLFKRFRSQWKYYFNSTDSQRLKLLTDSKKLEIIYGIIDSLQDRYDLIETQALYNLGNNND